MDPRASARELWRRARLWPLFVRRRHSLADPNTVFSRRRARVVEPHLRRLMVADPGAAARLQDPRLHGLRTWEYGVLLAAIRRLEGRRGWDVLDVGAGDSSFARFLLESKNAGSVTTLDLPKPHETRQAGTVERDEARRAVHVEGSMLDLPFADGSFDLVTCISAIEHLDGSPAQRRRREPKLPRDRYLRDTRRGLDEMMRVVRPGGLLYLTTDAYDPGRQETDAWTHKFCRPGEPLGPIWSAYWLDDVEGVFVMAVREAGFSLVGGGDYRAELLDDPDRSNYRGRYFTTFCVLARRPPEVQPQA